MRKRAAMLRRSRDDALTVGTLAEQDRHKKQWKTLPRAEKAGFPLLDSKMYTSFMYVNP